MKSSRKPRTTRRPSIAYVSTVCLACGRRARQVWTSAASVSTTRSSDPSTSGAKKTQNGISRIGVTLFRLRATVTTEATKRTPKNATPEASMPSCSHQRGRAGTSAWNSSIRIWPPSRVTYEAATNVRQMRKYLASSSAPASGTLNTPRIVICASGVTISAARRTRLTLRTAILISSKLFDGPDLLDVLAPLREVLVHLRQHRLPEAGDVEAVLFLDEHHALRLEVLAVFRGGLAVPVERLPAHLDHRVLHDLAVRGRQLLVDALVDEDREYRLHVVGHHHVLLHFIELQVVDVRQRVFLPDNQSCRQRRRQLRHFHRRRHRPHARDHRRPQLHRDPAIFLARHVLRRQHFFLRGEL